MTLFCNFRNTTFPHRTLRQGLIFILQLLDAPEMEHLPLPMVSRETELVRLDDDTDTVPSLPGFPMTPLSDAFAVNQRLKADLSTERLRRIYRILFFASRPENISPMHHQAIKGREVCITERPDLHLLWYYDRIFIKPVPKYLLSSAFWDTFLVGRKAPKPESWGGANGDDEDRLPCTEALGFLRSYSRLIQHESDFELAKKFNLFPRGVTITWETWCRFIATFASLRDREVSPRFHYGEIRLARLNFWMTLYRGETYCETHYSYASYFARFGALYIFVFGAVTVLLTGLQTGLATLDLRDDGKALYLNVAAAFVPFSLLLTIAGLSFLPLLFVFFQMTELLRYFLRHQPLS